MAGITSTKKIKGQPHLLAYITPNEVEKLKALGGQETMTKEGIPAYPEYDNYGYSSQRDFDAGNRSKSNDANVRGDGPNQNRVTASELAAINAREKENARKAKEKEKQKIIEEMLNTPVGRNKRLNAFQRYNSKFQRKRNLDLAKKRAFQKYQDVEQYVDPFDDYTMSGQKMAELRGYTFDDQGNITGYDRNKATAYGYDTSALAKGMDTLTSNKGTSIEKTRPNLYDVNSESYGVPGAILGKLRPDTQRTVLNTLGKAAEYNVLGINAPNMTNKEISDEMYRLKNLGRTQDQIDFIEGGGGGGGGSQQYIPYLPLPEEEVADETTFDYRFGNPNDNMALDVTLGRYSNFAANGGIMNAVPRQGYFLGKIVKGAKKFVGGVADAAGKVLKSDIGKMALIYGATAGLGSLASGGGFGSLFKAGTYNPANFLGKQGYLSKIAGKALLKDPSAGFGLKDNLSLGKILGLSAVLPFIPGLNKAPPNEDNFDDRGGSLIDPITGQEAVPAEMRASLNDALDNADGDPAKIKQIQNAYAFLTPDERLGTYLPYRTYGVKDGGRIGRAEGGLMNLGGMEKDYRAEGGFVPIGREEKADDVPARLSVNEFVFTADAVRNAGGGDIDRGAEVMENMMKNLENGGRVSEESQGNTGAQDMFSVSERIGEVI